MTKTPKPLRRIIAFFKTPSAVLSMLRGDSKPFEELHSYINRGKP